MNAINTDKKVQLTYGGLKSSTDTSGADYTIIGIPFDIRTTYRPGTRFGRWDSQSLFHRQHERGCRH